MNGYWEPHSSSVDFCEPNYLLTKYVAEPHNSWSSFAMIILAIIGLLYGNPTKEIRFIVMYIVLGLVGIGSVALHATLHWLPQSSDEIPMLWEVQAFLEMKSDKGKPWNSYLPIIFMITITIQTAIYYRFQEIYPAFLISYLGSTTAVLLMTKGILTEDINKDDMKLRWKVFTWGFIVFILLAGPVWLVDMNLCHLLLPYYTSPYVGGFTLHVFWHAFAAYGCYLFIVFYTIVRTQTLKQHASLEWVFGLVPVCKATRKADK